MTTKPENKSGKKLMAKVISDKMDKTRVVAIDEKRHHAIYRKSFVVTTKIKAHDAENISHTGDIVEIESVRPISKDKAWKITRKIESGK